MIKLKTLNNIQEVRTLLETLGDQLRPEISKSLNRAARGVRTDVNKWLVAETPLSKEDRDQWKFRTSTLSSLESEAILEGARIGLEKFDHTPTNVMTGRTTGGVSVNVLGKTYKFEHAFKGDPYRNGGKIWSRKIKGSRKHRPRPKYENEDKKKADPGRRLIGRFPLAKLTFKAVPQIVDNAEVFELVTQNAEGRFVKQFDHLVGRLIKE